MLVIRRQPQRGQGIALRCFTKLLQSQRGHHSSHPTPVLTTIANKVQATIILRPHRHLTSRDNPRPRAQAVRKSIPVSSIAFTAISIQCEKVLENAVKSRKDSHNAGVSTHMPDPSIQTVFVYYYRRAVRQDIKHTPLLPYLCPTLSYTIVSPTPSNKIRNKGTRRRRITVIYYHAHIILVYIRQQKHKATKQAIKYKRRWRTQALPYLKY